MREIKFDAIYTPTGEHFVPHTIDFNNRTVTGDWDGEVMAWCHFSLDGEYGDVILRQYTGLKDKNGIEIYEGDIVKLHRPPEDVVIRGNGYFDVDTDEGYTLTGVVKFLYNQWFIDEKNEKGLPLDFEGEKYREILGNQFEHRHLIDGEGTKV